MSACGATCGITKVRAREKERVLATIEQAFPQFRWHASHTEESAAVSGDEIEAIGAALEELLPVRSIVRWRGECGYLYLLAGVHEPSLAEVVDTDRERVPGMPESETYVRIAFSRLGRFVTLQEVRMAVTRDADGASICEQPIAGVEDRRLQLIVKGLQGALKKLKVIVLDMAFVTEAPPGSDEQREYIASFGQPPLLWAFLFEAAPPTTESFHLIDPC